ncbi:MAG: helix-turn-helix transcriptional regulator [Polyangiaceae bacterium]|nr:helix-turn-helix transcriptional regulator [Polyangiaceae bacterium]MCW5789709.1 helix-turn-helix transcriptional regulator [Polyangiaceae bacterium]
MDDAERVCQDLGQRVIELRKKRGLTQQQLAERLGIDPRDLRRVESGDNVTVRMLVRLAKALVVPIGDLFVAPKVRDARRPGRPRKVTED